MVIKKSQGASEDNCEETIGNEQHLLLQSYHNALSTSRAEMNNKTSMSKLCITYEAIKP